MAPAPSPSSATSTLTYCQWSTMENGGKREEDGEENRRPRGTESPEGSEGAEEDVRGKGGMEEGGVINRGVGGKSERIE